MYQQTAVLFKYETWWYKPCLALNDIKRYWLLFIHSSIPEQEAKGSSTVSYCVCHPDLPCFECHFSSCLVHCISFFVLFFILLSFHLCNFSYCVLPFSALFLILFFLSSQFCLTYMTVFMLIPIMPFYFFTVHPFSVQYCLKWPLSHMSISSWFTQGLHHIWLSGEWSCTHRLISHQKLSHLPLPPGRSFQPQCTSCLTQTAVGHQSVH